MSDRSCSICQKHTSIADFVVYKNNGLIVSHMPLNPESSRAYLGYFFIEPEKHILNMEELSDSQSELLGKLLKKLTVGLKELLHSERTYFFKFADITPHFHVHVYPRHPGTPKDIVGEAVRHWTNGPQGTHEEIKNLCQKMKVFLQ